MLNIAVAVATKESVRFPGKNSLLVHNKPLIFYLKRKVNYLRRNLDERFEVTGQYLISNEKRVIDQASKDWTLMSDDPSMSHQEIIHDRIGNKADLILVLQVNVPVMPVNCLVQLVHSYDPNFQKHSIFEEIPPNLFLKFPDDQAWPFDTANKLYKDTGAGSLWIPEALLQTNPKTKMILVPANSTLDIDYKWQTQSLFERLR